MAPDPGIDTEVIKDKARKDLLDLLEGVCKALNVPNRWSVLGLNKYRSEGRRTSLLRKRLLVLLACLSNSQRFKNTVSTRFSF